MPHRRQRSTQRYGAVNRYEVIPRRLIVSYFVSWADLLSHCLVLRRYADDLYLAAAASYYSAPWRPFPRLFIRNAQ